MYSLEFFSQFSFQGLIEVIEGDFLNEGIEAIDDLEGDTEVETFLKSLNRTVISSILLRLLTSIIFLVLARCLSCVVLNFNKSSSS